jgi:hypothetical protein
MTTQPLSHEEVRKRIRILGSTTDDVETQEMLESLLADNVRLSGEVKRLQVELRRVSQFSGTCGLSTDGINVFGDEPSIKRVKQWMYQAQMCDQLRARIGEKDERIAALERWKQNVYTVFPGIDGQLRFVLGDAALNPAGQCSGTATGREG